MNRGPDATIRAAWVASRRNLFYLKADLPVSDEELRRVRFADPLAGEFEPTRVAEVCRRLLGIDSFALTPLTTQGTFHRVYRGILHGQRVIVRVSSAATLYHDLSLHADSWVADTLHRHGLPAAGILCVDTSRTVCPYDVQIQEEIASPTVLDFQNDEPTLLQLLHALGVFCARVHSVRLSGYGPLDPFGTGGLLTTWPDYIGTNLEAHVRQCLVSGALSAREGNQVTRLFRLAESALDAPSALLHGDLGNYNALTDGNRIVGLLDWEDGLAGDPVYDLAFWATFHPVDRHECFLAGYRSLATLPADFTERFWLYYLRVALAKTVLRQRFGYPDRPGWPPASRRIQTALTALSAA